MATPTPTVRRAVRPTGFALIALSFQTLGIIYSDIGTSPLYVLNGIWPPSGPPPSKEDVIGGISCIFWALTLLPLLKYVVVALQFGTSEGEGGCFALYHGLLPPDNPGDEDRTLTGDSLQGPVPPSISENLLRFKWLLLPWTLFGTSLTMADGIFTPAVSITSAVGGIAVAAPSVTDNIIPISVGFIVVLFVSQRLGTAKLAVLFSPVTFIWLALIAVCGCINLAKYPGIWRAVDPSRAVLLFKRTGNYDLLAGILLAVTGCEAMFANLGQFSIYSIQLSFGCFAYPALVLAYLGQGARLIVDGDYVISNVFYKSIPGPVNGGLFWFTYIFAILATLVASQALITATFSLLQQLIRLKSFPPLRMIHTSDMIQGQIYIPAANWALGVITIVVVAAFKNLVALSNAYGFSVATVMFTSTTLMAVQCHYVKHLPLVVTAAFFVFFGFFDGLFWGAALKKVPHGAWVPLMIGIILVTVMIFWSWAKGIEDEFDGANRKNLRHFILKSGTSPKETLDDHQITEVDPPDESTTDGSLYLASEKGHFGKNLAVLPILAVFHKSASGKGIPHSFVGFLKQYPALPRLCVFLSVRVMPVARLPVEHRLIVNKVRSLDGFYGVTYQLGYREDFDVDVNAIVEEICKLERQAKGTNFEVSDDIVREIREISKGATHIVPHYNVVSKHLSIKGRLGFLTPVVSWAREVLIEEVYRPLKTFFPETANWVTSADEIIHVGVTARI